MTILAAIGDVTRFACPGGLGQGEPESVGQLFRFDAWVGAERGEGARQGHHEGRAAGVALPALAG
ncbi:MAG: hypothetical protein ABIL11_03745 [Chloroflexota bacterium]